jgi:hypoxanthine-guanine phosphoribosyltransferase
VSGNKEGETLKCAVRASFVGCYLTDVFLVSYCIPYARNARKNATMGSVPVKLAQV